MTGKKSWTVEQTDEQRVIANQIRFIILIRGIPLKIRFQAYYPGDNPGRWKLFGATNAKAVDSELATLGYFRHQISGPMGIKRRRCHPTIPAI